MYRSRLITLTIILIMFLTDVINGVHLKPTNEFYLILNCNSSMRLGLVYWIGYVLKKVSMSNQKVQVTNLGTNKKDIYNRAVITFAVKQELQFLKEQTSFKQ
uniref:Uncharacterized protein n=1 Tax=Glossina pallidipes TaxID=7398 RepID=A0A1A9ZBF6_GLOPL